VIPWRDFGVRRASAAFGSAAGNPDGPKHRYRGALQIRCMLTSGKKTRVVNVCFVRREDGLDFSHELTRR
jgi:hypothetical protein